jgi:hypothetical protein
LREALIRISLAAILRQECEQPVHSLVSSRIDHRSTLASDGCQIGVAEAVEVESQRVWRKLERGCDTTCRHPVLTRFDQDSENIETIILGERRKSCQRIMFFHISVNTEILTERQLFISAVTEMISLPLMAEAV